MKIIFACLAAMFVTLGSNSNYGIAVLCFLASIDVIVNKGK